MNSKTMKRIRAKSLEILCSWLHTLVPDEEKIKINIKNVDQFLAQQEYIYKNKTLYLSIYTKKWVVVVLKKMIKDGYTIDAIDYDIFNNNYKKYIYGAS